jgi:transposase
MPKRFTPETIEAIAADIKAGLSANDVCRKNDISKGAYYRWSKRLAKGIKAEKKTEAASKGHNGHFQAEVSAIQAAVIRRITADADFLHRVLVMALEPRA